MAPAILITDIADAFLASKQAVGRSPATLRYYKDLFRRLAVISDRMPLQPQDILYFVDQQKGSSPASKRHWYKRLRAVYTWLVRRSLLPLEANPFHLLATPKQVSKAQRVF